MFRHCIRLAARPLSLWLTLLLFIGNLAPAHAQDTITQPKQTPIRVSSKEFNEQLLLGRMLVMLLEEAGYPVVDMTGAAGSRAIRTALESGEIDLYPEYTGTALSLFHELPSDALPNSPERSYELVKSLDAQLGLVWLQPSAINNTFTLMVRQELIEQGIMTLADLADYMNANDAPLKVCVESEFFNRLDGLPGLQELYGFTFKEENILLMDSNEAYNNLRNGSCDVAEGYATDGRISAWGFTNLEDPLAFFPFYTPTPVVRTEILDEYPELADVINQLWQYLDNPTMLDLNARVDIGTDGVLGNGDEEKIEDVAYNFLVSKGLLKPAAIKVGSKEFSEQLLLGKMIVLLLQDAGYEVEDKTGLGGSPVVRTALERGEIDIYPEYTGTATSLHHNLPVSALPADAKRTYQLAKSLDAPQDLIWLDPAPLNNTYTLMVRQDLVEQGIVSLEDLAVYMNDNAAPLKVCVEGEFFSRPDGLDGLQELYGFAFNEDNTLVMEANETYNNLRESACDVAEGYSTDGRISAWGFQNLADPLAYFPFYQPAPVVRAETLKLYPEIADLLNTLMKDLDDGAMSALNARVDIGADGELASGDEESVEDVAYSYLRDKRLIKLPEIVISAADAAENYQLILGTMLQMVLADQGYQVVDQISLGGSLLVRDAMQKGEIDLYMESVSTALANFAGLPVTALPTDSKRAYQLIKSLDAAKGIVWMTPTSFSPSSVIAAQAEVSELGITALDELAQYMNENDAPFTICMDNNFYSRSLDGLASLEELYEFHFKPENVFLVDTEDVMDMFAKGECSMAAGVNIEVNIRNYTVLADPLFFFPATIVAPVIRQEVLERNVELNGILTTLSNIVNNETMSALETAIELGADGEEGSGDEETIEAAVRNFLLANDLILEQPATPLLEESTPITETTPVSATTISPALDAGETAPPITVASMDYAEQQLLGKLLVLHLRAGGYPVVDRAGVGSSPDLRSALESGDIDLYPEFPRTALTLFHNIPEDALPDNAEETYQLIKSLDETLDLAWLRRVSFDSTYAILIKQDLAATGIATIEDLVAYINNNQDEPLQFCAEADFLERTAADFATLLTLYAFEIPPETIRTLPADEIYTALRADECAIALALQTDGRVRAWGFVALEDTFKVLPTSTPSPVVRQAILDQYPELEAYLDKLSDQLDTAAITTLNAQIALGADGEANTGDEVAVEAVAETFLCETGLVVPCNTTAAINDEQPITPTTVLTETVAVISSTLPISTSDTLATIAAEEKAPAASAIVVEVTTPDSFGVNARAAASIDAVIVAVLPRNTTIRAIGRTPDGNWLQIWLPDNQIVWVFTAAVLTNPETLPLLPSIAPPNL